MGILITILTVVACILLVLVILIQNPKGGGLASGFSSANQIGGIRRTTDFLEKSTWTLLVAVLALSIVSTSFNGKSTVVSGETEEGIEDLVGGSASTPEFQNSLPTGTETTPATNEDNSSEEENK